MPKYSTYCLLTLLLTLATACRKDDEALPANTKKIDAVLLGRVENESGDPIAGALVHSGNKSAESDENGVFRFEGLLVTEGRASVRAEYPGTFTSARTFYPIGGSTNYVEVRLLSKLSSGTLNSELGGEISLPNSGAQVSLPPNAVVQADGGTYSGSVNVAMRHLDPTSPTLLDDMPGELVGLDSNGASTGLETYGMLAVELSGDNGQDLQLAEGKQAGLRFPVPSGLQGQAPAVIPLWYFDEEAGIWQEEGSAVLENGFYVGRVGHFSFWNCDYPWPVVPISGRVTLPDGTPVVNQKIEIHRMGGMGSSHGFTDSEGNFSGSVPAAEDLLLYIVDNCSNQLHSLNIPPSSAEIILENIVVPQTSVIVISGNLVNCDGGAVKNGYVLMETQNHSPIANLTSSGSFKVVFAGCVQTQSILATGWDLETGFRSEATSFSADADLNIGTLTACQTISDGFMNYALDLGNLNTNMEPANFMGNAVAMVLPSGKTVVAGFDRERHLILVFNGSGKGTFDLDPELSRFYPNSFSWQAVDMQVSVSAFGEADELMAGTFQGTFSLSGFPCAISGGFSARILTKDNSCEILQPFNGYYFMEQIGGGQGFEPLNPFIKPEIVFLENTAPNVRRITYLKYSHLGSTPLLYFACDKVAIPYILTGQNCEDEYVLKAPTDSGSFTPDDDLVFFVNLRVEKYAGDNNCTFVPTEELVQLRFTKQ